jgi:hypothetical protein
MNMLLVAAVVLGVGIGIAVGLVKRTKGSQGESRTYTPSPREPVEFGPARSGFGPKTGTWKTWDGTPYGAIDTLLADPDGDAAGGDFDGDGLPDW